MHIPRAVRHALVALAVIVGSALPYFGVTFARVKSMGSAQARARADVIVVMGAAQYDGRPSEMLKRRLQTALSLWNDGRAGWIAVTGGKKPGDRFTEAGASATWLQKRGVPTDRILREETGRSTWESLSGLAAVLMQSKVSTAIVVTTDWHEARAVLSLRELGFRAQPASAGPAQSTASRWMRETLAVGIGRIIGFERLYRITG